MRKIYTLLCALMASMAIWAQNPDPSKWSVGDNVIKDLGMGDVDPTEPWTMKNRYYNGNSDTGDYGEYWKGVGQKFFFDYIDREHDVDANSSGNHIWDGHGDEGQTAVGFYGDGHVTDNDPDLYQVVYLPPGFYTVRVQACYRDCSGGGTQVDDAVKNYVGRRLNANGKVMTEKVMYDGDEVDRNIEGIIMNGKYTDGVMTGGYRSFIGTYKKNAQIYADILTAEDPESEVTREFYTSVKHMGDTDLTKQLCSWGDSWRQDKSVSILTDQYDEDDETWLRKRFYFPCSIMGASLHFKQGNYWNELNILVEEPSWVRLGIRKVGYITEDWMAFSEWQVIYKGEASEAVQLEFAEQEYDYNISQFEKIQEKFNSAKFAGFDVAFNKAIADGIGDELQYAEEEKEGAQTLADWIKLNNALQAKLDAYDETYEYLNNLSFLFVRCDVLIKQGGLPGLSAFQGAYSTILNKVNSCTALDFAEKTPLEFSQECFNDLADARGAYLDTQEADENGAKDFSAVINQPWFVNDGVKISQSEEGNFTTSFIDEEGWIGDGSDDSYYDGENLRWTDRPDIASTVTFVTNDTEVKNKWYVENYCEGARSEGYALSCYHGLLGPKDNYHSGKLTAGYMGMCQNIVGLPKGYYSLKALVRTWDSNGDGRINNLIMQNTKGDEVTAPVGVVDDDHGWKEQTTGIIDVDDRQLLIGFRSEYTSQFTGFRLLFYGTEPPVEKLLTQQIDEINEQIESLDFLGDQKEVEKKVAKCVKPFTIDNFDEYRGYLNDARNYITKAKNAYKNNKALETYTTLEADYTGVRRAGDILLPASMKALDLGTEETDTYLDIEPANNLASKYSEYLKVYQEAVGYNDAALNDVLATQESVLTADIQTEDVLDAYMKQLNLPINISKMKSLDVIGAGVGGKAPADITGMIVNPSFDKHIVNGEWVDNSCELERGYADGWNNNSAWNKNNDELSINEYEGTMVYSRGNCEIWNAGTGEFYQELGSVPAGTYTISCLAVYRDCDDLDDTTVNGFEVEAGGKEENWANHNAVLFARTDSDESTDYIKAIQNCKGDDFSFTEVITGYEPDEETKSYFATAATVLGLGEDASTLGCATSDELKWTHIAQNTEGKWATATYDEDLSEWTYGDEGIYPFDLKINGSYYPNSMYGITQWFVKAPEKLRSTVTITVKHGETLRIGLRKNASIANDCITFDDFKIEFVDSENLEDVLTGIEEVDSEEPATNNVLYNTAGQVVNDSYQGIVITSDGKKVYKK
ncbi:MAG: hypothetical protein IKP41_03640 [Bacteroidaceae bacterium]|nr:hypothetical protein [Bacteroidaceae bacterium]